MTFGAYRVFGCEGSTESDIMLAAMERAFADRMDVFNMSIGSAFQWPQYPTAVASNRLIDRGMVVVASIGNSGTNGLYAAGAPGLGRKGDWCGSSFDNTDVVLPVFSPFHQTTPKLAILSTGCFSKHRPTSGTISNGSDRNESIHRGCLRSVASWQSLAGQVA